MTTSHTSPKPPYIYPPLQPHPNSIRLLRLLPASSPHSPINIQILSYSLTTPPRTTHLYECLSYVWGPTSGKKPIYIDDTSFPVTQNLHSALRQLRDCELERVLWVDAVCINQEDVEERAQQVGIMAMIYACASRVVVWLGEEEEGSGEAMEWLRSEASRVYRRQRNLQDVEEDRVSEVGEGSIDALRDGSRSGVEGDDQPNDEEKPQIDRAQQHAVALLRRSWFRRIWVLQEIAAARVMVVLCGSEELTGACFFWGLSAMLSLCKDPYIHGTISSIIYLLGDTSVMRLNDNTRSNEPFRLGICPLSQLLDMFRVREATDRRDKVYALLGLTSTKPGKSDIVPNYEVEWSALFQELVRSTLGKKVEAVWKIENGKEYGHISGRGCTLGFISDVDNSRSDRQTVLFTPTYHRNPEEHLHSNRPKIKWILHNSATAVRAGDMVCRLEGDVGFTIIRLELDRFIIVVVSARPPAFHKENIVAGEPSPDYWNECFSGLRTEYNRNFRLSWIFDVETAAEESTSQADLKQGVPKLATLSDMIRILEDVNDVHGIEELAGYCDGGTLSSETDAVNDIQHFQDVHRILPNWNLYLHLKCSLQNVIASRNGTLKAANNVDLDAVNVRSRLVTDPACGPDLIRYLLSEITSIGSTWAADIANIQPLGIHLSFILDTWGDSWIHEAILELIEIVECHSHTQNTTLGYFSSPLVMEIVEVIVKAAAQHPQWGNIFMKKLLKFSRRNVNRMFCLLRAIIVCTDTAADWQQAVVVGVTETHFEELLSAKIYHNALDILDPEELFRAVVNFLWDHYILHAKDYIGISIDGRFLLRREVMENTVLDYKIWEACLSGRVEDLQTAAGMGTADPQVLITRKDAKGKWYQAVAFEVAAMNSHVECCRTLLNNRFIKKPLTYELWQEICQRGNIPNVEKVNNMVTSYNPRLWGATPLSIVISEAIHIAR